MENQPYNNPTPPPPVNYLSPSDERMWGMLAHLSALAGFIIPFGNVVGPIVVWQIQKDKSAYVDYHGKEALNFQITMTIAYGVAILLIVLLIGFPILIVLGLISVVLSILAGVKANNGEYYKYPFTFRFIR
ncbi:hypothetical protein LX87_05156 [Larkinella arboricola]|uniref:Tic20 family protein n=1 Tax=Larkinella arboricola TaxID=643671 RepID=A0A327WKP0_LARAB|nr:DUF4870 domain-containing protein [Larkinella arboricola]RAJ92189.1 hypothetical protein LX87_05156 [Larkinella arboricola]